ncbi:MAG: hypothetical protein UT42_C0030G0003 [Candidatus Falkowbacteria bacterium GW2011_GWA2_39_24]|uniref:Uncharacterized protein n=1 Tax=Candidatus Falkowbacteria bacterium GW2011_GWA2_39_24 TaxID=1618634 RepID=A0A0G0NNI2_9BACT|nr:MAG: hypothetical protein UT22_C0043G0003 [Parcubacteria group bacterium GW2011_GWC2_39_11]KKR14366.1 MAG: hypothetical protein UT42_C0030G0003 [Candidatus Falkowbacteria bacterium GW2011_GWA2_39_24]
MIYQFISCYNQHKKQGISVIEILIVVFIIGAALASLITIANLSLVGAVQAKRTVQAESLARGMIESSRNFRDGTSWNINGLGGVVIGVPYHFEKSEDSQWQLSPDADNILGFSSQLIFSDVFRDTSDNIVEQGGIKDPDSKKATVTVSWQEKGRSHQVSLFAYFTNWQ